MLKTTKRFLAVLLCIVLTFSMMATVFAEESTETTGTVSETEEVAAEAEEGSTEVAGEKITGEKVLGGNTEITKGGTK